MDNSTLPPTLMPTTTLTPTGTPPPTNKMTTSPAVPVAVWHDRSHAYVAISISTTYQGQAAHIERIARVPLSVLEGLDAEGAAAALWQAGLDGLAADPPEIAEQPAEAVDLILDGALGRLRTLAAKAP